MAQKQRSNNKNNQMDIEILDQNENDKNECTEEIETTFTPIQKLEVLSNLLFN